MSSAIRLSGVTLNAPDAIGLARFYADITDGEARGGAEWAVAHGPHATLAFQQDPDFRTPTWPGGETPMQVHVEFLVDDLDATRTRVLGAGARELDVQPNAAHCLVFADPAGHPFCLSTWETPLLE